MSPRGKARGEAGRARLVRIHVGRDAEAPRSGTLDTRLERVVERRPGNVVLDVALLLEPLLLHALVQRAERPTFTEDLAGHALADVGLRAAVGEQRIDRPGEHVDESWRDREAGGVELARASGRDRANGRDPLAVDGDVAAHRRPAAAAVEHAAADEDLVGRGHGPRWERAESHGAVTPR